jgi:hypothetical protein
MIVYGTRATLRKTEYIFDACPSCRATNSVQVSVYQRYAHVFWIPFFPIGKTGISVCNSCRQVLKKDQMPAALRMSYDNLKSQTKIPVWNFTGLFLIAAIIIAVTVSQKQTAEKVTKLLSSPKINDIFSVKMKDDEYTLLKVKKVEGDTVYFFPNKLETNQESDLSNLFLKGDEGFDHTMTYGLARSTLETMNKKDEIIDIDRK